MYALLIFEDDSEKQALISESIPKFKDIGK